MKKHPAAVELNPIDVRLAEHGAAIGATLASVSQIKRAVAEHGQSNMSASWSGHTRTQPEDIYGLGNLMDTNILRLVQGTA